MQPCMPHIEMEEVFKGIKGEKRVYYPLSKLSSFRVGGKGDLVIFPKDLDDLILLRKRALEKGIPLTLIGFGSNLLIRDGGVRGVTVILRKGLNYIRVSGRRVIAGGGTPLHELTKETARHSLSGLEFLAGIPGTVGGAVFMNAGTNKGEIKDSLLRITLLDSSGEVEEVKRGDIPFGYRQSGLPEGGIVVEAEFQLKEGKREEIEGAIESEIERRKKKGEYKGFNAGSIFKNPEGYFAGRLIEEAGLKGYRVGGAIVSNDHANFILNEGGATAGDILDLIAQVKDRVYKKNGLLLEEEIRIIGEG